MSATKPFGQRGRLLAIAICLVALFGLFVGYGTLSYDPVLNDYPDENHVAPNPDAYIGDRVGLGGTVVATDPVTIEAGHPDGTTFVLEDADAVLQNADDPLEKGNAVTAFGTLETASILETERTITRETWEMQYLYVVSFLGGCWVVGRFVRGRRLDRERFAFVPRNHLLTLEHLR